MRLLRWITKLLFIVFLVVFLILNIVEIMTKDSSYPQITVPPEPLEISISAEEAELLSGVTAYDEKDGDLTNSIMIESISAFIAENTCEITYAVADEDRHVSKAKRLLTYTDYTPPRVYLRRPLVFSVGERVDFRNIIGVIDCIGGDISDTIAFVASDFSSSIAGAYTLSVQITGVRGDTVYYDFPAWVEQNLKTMPSISLTENLIYVKTGDEPDFASFVSAVSYQDELLPDCVPVITTDYNADLPGLYAVHYYATAADGKVGHTILTVIVEE